MRSTLAAVHDAISTDDAAATVDDADTDPAPEQVSADHSADHGGKDSGKDDGRDGKLAG